MWSISIAAQNVIVLSAALKKRVCVTGSLNLQSNISFRDIGVFTDLVSRRFHSEA